MKQVKKGNETATATVGALIEELEKFDKDATIFTEGCDCIGNVVSVKKYQDKSVLICRDN